MVAQREIVLLSFPFSDLRTSKVRPAIVLSNDRYNRRSQDFIAIPLTSNLKRREYAVLVTNDALEQGRLIIDSMARVDRIFSINNKLVRMSIGRVKTELHGLMVRKLSDLVHDSADAR